jgi:hypothetical protein
MDDMALIHSSLDPNGVGVPFINSRCSDQEIGIEGIAAFFEELL